MKKIGRPFVLMIAFVITTSLALAGGQGVSYSGGDGTTMAKAVVINGATESTGLDAEDAWLAKHFRGYELRQQSLLNSKGKMYDAMDITTQDGKKMTVYFDITGFFGK